MVARFVGGLRQNIQHTLNLFNPLSVAEAHQQALTVETQTRVNYSSWSSARTPCTVTGSLSPSLIPEAPALKPETALVPADILRRPDTLRCFSCGEIGHRQSVCPSSNKCGLLLDTSGRDVEIIDEMDEEISEEPFELEGDTGHLLMLRRTCLAPRKHPELSQRNALFQSRCTINGKVCKFIIDSGS